MGIAIDPPDVNRSARLFTVVEKRIVYGLKAIKGIGDGPAEAIVNCRKEGGPFISFMEFLDRLDIKSVGKAVVEVLIKTGAFDNLEPPMIGPAPVTGGSGIRAVLLGNLEKAVEYAQGKKEDKLFGQSSLFEDTGEKTYPDFVFEPFPAWDRMEQLEAEQKLIGFYFSGHPLDDYREAWEQNATLNVADLENAKDGDYVIVGIVKSLKLISDKNGNQMAFASLQDYNGEVDLTFFGKVWKTCADDVAVEGRAAFRGRLDTSRAKPGFIVNSVMDLEKMQKKAARLAEEGKAVKTEAVRSTALKNAEASAEAKPAEAGGEEAGPSYRELHIRISQVLAEREENLYPLRDCLIDNPGSCEVFIHVPDEGQTVIRAARGIIAAADEAAISALKNCGGVAAVWAA
jgi:DNA polymerase-3 subunit alpha